MILYKYLPPCRIDILVNQKIRFTQPPCFNDPFECSPFIKGMGLTSDEFSRVGEKELRTQGVSEEEIIEIINEMHTDENINKIFPRVNRFMLDLFSKAIGILSLSERNDSILMWSHYTQNHEGFVIGFDTNSDFFITNPKGATYTIGELNKVIYSYSRPTNYLIKMELHELYFTKSQEWAYEKEWRFFKSIDSADEVVENGEYPVYLYSFSADTINSIIIGIRAKDDFVAQIKSLLCEDRYKHVCLYKAEIDERSFKINIVRVNENGI